MSNFGSTCPTPSERNVWKQLKLPKSDKGHSNLVSFLEFTSSYNCLYGTYQLGVGKGIEKLPKFDRNELRF